jgi:hypothetical protein
MGNSGKTRQTNYCSETSIENGYLEMKGDEIFSREFRLAKMDELYSSLSNEYDALVKVIKQRLKKNVR